MKNFRIWYASPYGGVAITTIKGAGKREARKTFKQRNKGKRILSVDKL